MKTRPFKQVDVFTAEPYRGNPLAVVLDGRGLSAATMQGFTRWTNLSETTFVLPPTDPTADYRVRIFTPGGELPFAGHPTLGSCHAWLQAGGQPKAIDRVVQQCAAGLIAIRRPAPSSGERMAFAAPPLKRSAPSARLLAQVSDALGLHAQQIVAAQLLDNGPVWLGLLLADADTVLELEPDHRALRDLGQKVGVAGIPAAQSAPFLIARASHEARAFSAATNAVKSETAAKAARTENAASSAKTGHPANVAPAVDIEVRAFASPVGVDEDPVTGSFNAGLAEWLMAEGRMPARYLAGQGQALGRDGRVHVERDADGTLWIGGDVVTCIDGQVTL